MLPNILITKEEYGSSCVYRVVSVPVWEKETFFLRNFMLNNLYCFIASAPGLDSRHVGMGYLDCSAELVSFISFLCAVRKLSSKIIGFFFSFCFSFLFFRYCSCKFCSLVCVLGRGGWRF